MNDNVKSAKRLLAEALCAIEVAKDGASVGPVRRRLDLASANAEQALMWLDGVQASAAFYGFGYAEGEQGPLHGVCKRSCRCPVDRETGNPMDLRGEPEADWQARHGRMAITAAKREWY